jgi:hypothetical protein
MALMGTLATVAPGCHGSDTLTPTTGRCGPTPRLLVSAANYWPGHAGDGAAYVAGMALDGSDLYYSAVILASQLPINPGALMHVSTNGGAAMQLADGYQFQIEDVSVP